MQFLQTARTVFEGQILTFDRKKIFSSLNGFCDKKEKQIFSSQFQNEFFSKEQRCFFDHNKIIHVSVEVRFSYEKVK